MSANLDDENRYFVIVNVVDNAVVGCDTARICYALAPNQWLWMPDTRLRV